MWTTGVDLPALDANIAEMRAYGFGTWSRAGREIARRFSTEGSPVAALEQLENPCPTLHLYAQPSDDEYLTAQQAIPPRSHGSKCSVLWPAAISPCSRFPPSWSRTLKPSCGACQQQPALEARNQLGLTRLRLPTADHGTRCSRPSATNTDITKQCVARGTH